MNKVLVIGAGGYIGSKLSTFLIENKIEVSCLDIRENTLQIYTEYEELDYEELNAASIEQYKHIILLAAQSSVALAESNPLLTLQNNVLKLQKLLGLQFSHQILHFASSASVYDGSRDNASQETDSLSASRNIYDLSKKIGEELISLSSKPSIIYRFGTVNGPSPNMRLDLVVNSMVKSAIERQIVKISNGTAHRAILSTTDLCRVFYEIINRDNSMHLKEILNLSSFNCTIDQIGQAVAKRLSVPIEYMANSSTYDFSVNNQKMKDILNGIELVTLNELIDSLIEHYQKPQ